MAKLIKLTDSLASRKVPRVFLSFFVCSLLVGPQAHAMDCYEFESLVKNLVSYSNQASSIGGITKSGV